MAPPNPSGACVPRFSEERDHAPGGSDEQERVTFPAPGHRVAPSGEGACCGSSHVRSRAIWIVRSHSIRSFCLEASLHQGSTHTRDLGGQATSHRLIFKERACHSASRSSAVGSSNAASWKPRVPATLPPSEVDS